MALDAFMPTSWLLGSILILAYRGVKVPGKVREKF